MPRFHDRAEAGRILAQTLAQYAGRDDVIILALPRGGVPVGQELAKALGAPLDVFLVRKLGIPGHEEVAMGSIAAGGVRVLNDDVVESLRISPGVIEEVARREQVELQRRDRLYRGGRPLPPVQGKVVILVDDGLATGATMRAAVRALRAMNPQRIVAAAPVGALEACQELAREADQVVCIKTPAPFYSVGTWYDDFRQTTDQEVLAILDKADRAAEA